MLLFTCQDEMIFLPVCHYETTGPFYLQGHTSIIEHFKRDSREKINCKVRSNYFNVGSRPNRYKKILLEFSIRMNMLDTIECSNSISARCLHVGLL